MPDSARQARNFHPPVHHLRGEETLGWGIIGASNIAAQHFIPALRAQAPLPIPLARYPMTSAWVVGLFSHSERRSKDFAAAHQIAPFVNLADLLRHPEIHCVYIGCHPRHHATFALAALAAGKHVFCEPPLGLTIEEAQTVVHTAANRGLVAAVNFAHRADPAIATLRELLLEGEIGEVLGGRISNAISLRPLQQTWRLRSQGGGVILDRATHSLDLLRFLLRDEIAAVHFYHSQQLFGTDVEEDTLSLITLRRTLCTIQSHDSFVIPHLPTSLELYGSSGAVLARHCLDHEHPSELYLRRNGIESRIRLPILDPFFIAIERFHQTVRANVHSTTLHASTHEPPLAGGLDGIAAITAVHAAQESLRRGQRVDLPHQPRTMQDKSYI